MQLLADKPATKQQQRNRQHAHTFHCTYHLVCLVFDSNGCQQTWPRITAVSFHSSVTLPRQQWS
jgi:hypothetical protein